jgi:protein phosphatase
LGLRCKADDLSDLSKLSNDPKGWSSTVDVAALSDIGMRRANNQDSFRVAVADSASIWQRQGHLFLVADGMGAHAAGELASKMAVDLIPHHLYKHQELAPAESLARAFQEANADIFRRGHSSFEFHSMGTTCSALALLPEGAVIAHVGDSRVYQLDGDTLYQLTFDHSLVWEMQAAGRVTEEAARSGLIPKNVITRSLGPNADVLVDLEGPFPVRKGNRFLLCSDGLSGQIPDEEIAVILKLLAPAQAAQFFVDLSNLRGGPDNITAVVVQVATDQIVTGNSEPIAPQPEREKASFSKALGLVAAICLLVAVALAAIGQMALAVVTGALGVAALLAGIVQMSLRRHPPAQPSTRYGMGPHRAFSVRPSESFFQYLAGTMKPLREATEEQEWKVDWSTVNEQFAKACRFAEERDFSEAIRLQAEVIINLMGQIRNQRGDNASDSEVNL